MTIKILNKVNKEKYFPKIIKKGEWIDLYTSEDAYLKGPSSKGGHVTFSSTLIPLGVCMQLPKGCEAIVAPRSSIYKNHGVILANSIGVIDNCYNGPNDVWKFNAIAFKTTEIPAGTRICQFRIQLSQQATFIDKIRWLFPNKIKIEYVKNLENKNRGGFGSTGK